MCGIVGIITSNPSREELQSINELLYHRGPDDSGVYIGEGVGMAVRRLSIVDIEGGGQPLSNEDGTVWVACNGEIVNAPALRQELSAAGHHFRTKSDTETIVHAYEEWGDQAVSRLSGMFAFGLWDSNKRRFLLVRDRFGIKPLYYAEAGGRFAFSSEIRALLEALPELPRRADHQVLRQMFEIGFLPPPATAFEGILEMPAAHMLVIDNGERRPLQRYWFPEPPDAGDYPSVDFQKAADEFVGRLEEIVNDWRMSDVPVGSMLSGGIDSSSLAALLTKVNGEPIHTFTIGFPEFSFDEASEALETADFIHSRHHKVTFSMDDFNVLPQIVRHQEKPSCYTHAAHFKLFDVCRQAGFKVIMVGEGADELLGGYPWYRMDLRARLLLRLPFPIRKGINRYARQSIRGLRRILASNPAPDAIERYIMIQQWGIPQWGEQLLNLDSGPSVVDLWRDRFGEKIKNLHPFDQFVYLDRETRMVNFINFGVDRMSMAHSVEARPPFLDHTLWEHAMRLPPSVKINFNDNKRILRRGMRGMLPEATIKRPKKGLGAPFDAWWRAERLPDWAEDFLSPTALSDTGYFNAAGVGRIRKLHSAGQVRYGRLLTGVLTTQLWHKEFL